MLNEKMLMEIVKKNVDILKLKNQNYGSANLLGTGLFGVCVRLQDKVSRLLNLTKGGSVKNHFESVADNFSDVVNYATLAQLMLAGGLTYDSPVDKPKSLPRPNPMHRYKNRPGKHPPADCIVATIPRVHRKR